VFSDDQDRARSVPDNPFGRTAHEDVLETRVAVSRNDDQIGLGIAGNIRDDLECCSYLNEDFFQKAWIDRLLRQSIQLVLHWPDGKSVAHGEIGQVDRVGRRFNSVQDRDLGSELLCKWDRVIERLLRDSGKIYRDKDAFKPKDRLGAFNPLHCRRYAARSMRFFPCVHHGGSS
jgi:hypothetical protein